jgi:hypothetical protein
MLCAKRLQSRDDAPSYEANSESGSEEGAVGGWVCLRLQVILSGSG